MPDIKFSEGLCVCGNHLWQVTLGKSNKYMIAIIVKGLLNGHPAYVWQWYCRQCGTVHHEPFRTIIHEQK